jgi:hypothetical protein
VPPQEIPFAVFTTPWPNDSIEGLADRVLELGFDGAKSPVRPGFQVAPENVERRLPELVDQFAARQLSALSIASTLQEPVLAACAAALCSQPSTRTKELLTGCAVRTWLTPGPYSRERPVSLLAGEGG